MKPTINIIGAGKLGKTLAKLMATNQAGVIQGVCNTSGTSGREAVGFIGQGEVRTIHTLLPADITLITTSDDQIAGCCEQLSKNPHLKIGSIVAHCSGSLSSEILIRAKEQGCFVASVHPMCSFAQADMSFAHYQGTYCAIEGDDHAIAVLSLLFNSMGSVMYTVDKQKKEVYHAAGVFASNYLLTLFQNALICLKDAAVENEMAIKMLIKLMRGTIDNLEVTLSPEKSLTGPIQRGDIHTVMKHVNSLPQAIAQLYKTLGLATLDISNLSEDKKKEIEERLQ